MDAVARDLEHAADHVRAANHSTMRGVLDVPQAYTAVGNLTELVARLPQILDYLARSVRRADPQEHYDDRGCDALGPLVGAQEDLRDARAEVEALTAHLRSAHKYLSHLDRVVSAD